MLYVLICSFFTAHSLHSFEAQRTLSFFFLSADPGGIGSAPEKHTSCFTGQAFHWAEEGRKEKTATLRDFFVNNCIFSSIYIHCKLEINDPPEADCFSFAALSAANENNIFLGDLGVSSPRSFLR